MCFGCGTNLSLSLPLPRSRSRSRLLTCARARASSLSLSLSRALSLSRSRSRELFLSRARARSLSQEPQAATFQGDSRMHHPRSFFYQFFCFQKASPTLVVLSVLLENLISFFCFQNASPTSVSFSISLTCLLCWCMALSVMETYLISLAAGAKKKLYFFVVLRHSVITDIFVLGLKNNALPRSIFVCKQIAYPSIPPSYVHIYVCMYIHTHTHTHTHTLT